MKVAHLSVFVLTLLAAISLSAPIQEPVYWDAAAKIREEGLNNSHIMEDIGYMTDVYGPRLAKSRAHRAAVEWAIAWPAH